jgi:nucleotide sugar dehydrogenase
MCNRMGIDVWEVIDAAKTKPFGFMPFYPGPGIGGHCIPLDPFYLSWKAKQFGFESRFIELAGVINGQMPHFIVGKIVDALNRFKKSVNGAKVLILGVAYKRDISDVRESPARCKGAHPGGRLQEGHQRRPRVSGARHPPTSFKEESEAFLLRSPRAGPG